MCQHNPLQGAITKGGDHPVGEVSLAVRSEPFEADDGDYEGRQADGNDAGNRQAKDLTGFVGQQYGEEVLLRDRDGVQGLRRRRAFVDIIVRDDATVTRDVHVAEIHFLCSRDTLVKKRITM